MEIREITDRTLWSLACDMSETLDLLRHLPPEARTMLNGLIDNSPANDADEKQIAQFAVNWRDPSKATDKP